MTDTTKREAPNPWDIGFGIAVLAGSVISLLVWFPADIPTGFFHTNAIGREEPGDAFFPIILAVLLGLLSIIQLAFSLRRHGATTAAAPSGELTGQNLWFLGVFIAITATGLAIMYWLGPITVAVMNVFGGLDASYRQLTDAAPYKYIGYVVGGFMMTMTLIVWTEGRIRLTGIFTVVTILVLAILVFDVLLKNVLLPPNADF